MSSHPMTRLHKALSAWGTPAFNHTLKEEIEAMEPGLLPLQQGLSTGSYVGDGAVKVMIIGVSDEGEFIRAKAGIFYSGVIAGCSCADDPTPIDERPEYCELQFDIDKKSAETAVRLLPE